MHFYTGETMVVEEKVCTKTISTSQAKKTTICPSRSRYLYSTYDIFLTLDIDTRMSDMSTRILDMGTQILDMGIWMSDCMDTWMSDIISV